MKKKLFALLLSSAMVATILVGCGSTPAPKTEPTEEATAEAAVEEAVPEQAPTEETNPQKERKLLQNYNFQWGTVDVYENPDDELLVDCDVSATFADNSEMSFTFSGPKAFEKLNEDFSNDTEEDYIRRLGSEDVSSLMLFGKYDVVDDSNFESYLNFSKEDWLESIMPDYVPDGYYSCDVSDDVIKVIIEIEMKGTDIKGYSCILVDKNLGAYYEFDYATKVSGSDNTQALDVVNSISCRENTEAPVAVEDEPKETVKRSPSEKPIKNYNFDWGNINIYNNPEDSELLDFDVHASFRGNNELYLTFSGPQVLGTIDEILSNSPNGKDLYTLCAEDEFILFKLRRESNEYFESISKWKIENWCSYLFPMKDIQDIYCEDNSSGTTRDIILGEEETGFDNRQYYRILFDPEAGYLYYFEYSEDRSLWEDNSRALAVLRSIKLGE